MISNTYAKTSYTNFPSPGILLVFKRYSRVKFGGLLLTLAQSLTHRYSDTSAAAKPFVNAYCACAYPIHILWTTTTKRPASSEVSQYSSVGVISMQYSEQETLFLKIIVHSSMRHTQINPQTAHRRTYLYRNRSFLFGAGLNYTSANVSHPVRSRALISTW